MSPRPLVLAHRGASARAPENTLEAFALARELGADGVELDARRTADGTLVVHHDPQCEHLGLLADHAFAEVREMHPEIPTLAEALAACAGLIVNVEIKCLPWEPDPDGADRHVVHRVADTIRAAGADTIVSSFDLGAVDACRAYAPEITTAWLTSGRPVHDGAARAAERGHAWLHPDRMSALQASPEVVAQAHALGVRVDVWTVDDPEEVRRLAAIGVDGICTNVPDVALAALSGGSD